MYKPYNWQFNKEVVSIFDEHIKKSVPLYKTFHKDIVDMSVYFAQKNSNIVDIGTSTGVLVSDLYNINKNRNIKCIGIDIEEDMINEASKRYPDVEFICADALSFDFSNTSVVTIMLTLQFLSNKDREFLLKKIHDEMNLGGAVFIVEKIRTSNPEIHDIYNDIYYDFKREGFSDTEILEKNISLRGIMKPLTLDKNIEIIQNAGFSTYDIFLKYNNFIGILAVKEKYHID